MSKTEEIDRRLAEMIEVARRDYMAIDGGRPFFMSIMAQFPYMVDFDAPVLKGPVGILDILEGRLDHPHPVFLNKKTGRSLDGSLHQGDHSVQSAAWAMNKGWDDEVVTAAFLHDFGKLINRRKHSYFSAEMIRPYVSEKTYWMVLVHFDINKVVQPNDERLLNKTCFEERAARVDLKLEAIRQHRWYEDAVKVRECDDEGRVTNLRPNILPELKKILDRTFKLTPEGLGRDNNSSTELWKMVLERCWMT